MEPKYSKNALLSKTILSKTEEFVNVAKNIGFNEFRVTGGEPLLFENISELFSIFLKKEVSYTILTNGMNIQKYFKLFESNKPKKITLSYHSKINHNSIFEVKYDTDLLDNSIRELCERGINLTVSITFLEKNKEEIISHVLYLKSLGVKSVKLIYPNNEKIKMGLKSEFIEVVKKLKLIEGIDIRHSEIKTSICAMINRGFLSFSTSESKIYGCCNLFSNKSFICNVSSPNDLEATLWKHYYKAQILKKFPCMSYVDFCPIALNN